MYFLCFRLKGFEFECDQDFDVINHTAKPHISARVPSSNIPALWWSEQVQVSGNAATPAFVFIGYSLIEPIETDTPKLFREKLRSERLEGELAYAFPLTSSVRLGFRGRFFWIFDTDQTANYKRLCSILFG